LFKVYFPEIKPITVPVSQLVTGLFAKLGLEVGPSAFWLLNNLGKIISERVEENKKGLKKKDFVQLLIDSSTAEHTGKDDDGAGIENNNSTTRYGKYLTQNEINYNLFSFFFAGYETTLTALNTCFFILNYNPEETRKLQDEIDSIFYDNGVEITYESLNSLEYLDMFIKEVLRMYPLGSSVITRRCEKACEINKIKIPAGQTVAIDVLSLHYDQQYWGNVDVNTFYPQRFEKKSEINPCVYMPFGIGPRICVGMRLAILEIKEILVQTLKNFDLKPCDVTPRELSYQDGYVIRKPSDDIRVTFLKRSRD
jgi:cytochrome P450